MTTESQAQPQETPAPVSNDDAIGSFARGFLQDLEDNPDPDEIRKDEVEAPLEAAEPQAEAEIQEQPEAETPTPEVPMVEVDVDGEKYLVPEKVKHRVMADKDYRQKTMEVAAHRKHLEQLTATAAQLAQQAQQLAPYHAQLFQMDNHAQFLQQRLGSQELASDPVEYNRVQGELAILLHQRERLASGLQQQVSQFTQQQQQLRLQKLQTEAPKLLEEFPDLKKPEVQQKLAKYVQDEGLPAEALDYLNYSAAGTKIAYKAHLYDLMVADQAKAKAKLQEKVKTLPSATQSSRVADGNAKNQQLQKQWAKSGGKLHDPAFDQLLKSRIRGG